MSLVACGSSSGGPSAASGGSSAAAGSGGTTASAGQGGGTAAGAQGGGTGGADGAACPSQSPERVASNAGHVRLPVRFVSTGEALALGEPATAADGRSYTPSGFRLFLSQPRLLGSGAPQPAQWIDGSSGRPLPYGVLLLDFDGSREVVLAAPAGDYTGLDVMLGLSEACNSSDPTKSVFPLNVDSEMYWSWGARYRFLVMEGSMTLNEESGGFGYHVGAESMGSTGPLEIEGALQVRVGGSEGPALVLDLGNLVAPAPAQSIDSIQHVSAAPWLFQNLAQNEVLSFGTP